MNETRRAIVLLSGGLDSATALAELVHQRFDPFAMTFRYGQRHSAEIAAAQRVAKQFDVREHVIIDIDLRVFGGRPTSDVEIPKGRVLSNENEIPITYVPARNTIFLSFALAWAEVLGSSDMFIGVNAWTTVAIRIAGRNTSRRMSGWRISPRKPVSRDGNTFGSILRCCN